MREDQVENGVKFLVHPKVKTAPLSQRISFLENKGLTSEEISAALSRVEGGGIDEIASSAFSSDATGLGGGGANNSAMMGTSPFPTEPEVPLWKKLAVPGALALGVVGALGTYHAAAAATHRSHAAIQTASSSSQGSSGSDTANADGASAGYGTVNGNLHDDSVAVDGRLGIANGLGVVEANPPRDYRLEGDVNTCSPGSYPLLVGANNNDANTSRGIGGANGELAGEFRRLSEAMEQQTGQLVEAVGAMKTLASRAEQDSSSLLAARVSSHTSELRAELGTIKQLLLLQAGGGGGVGAGKSSAEGGAGAVKTGAGVAARVLASGDASNNGSVPGTGDRGLLDGKVLGGGGAADSFKAVKQPDGVIDDGRVVANCSDRAEEKTPDERDRAGAAAKDAAVAAATAHRKEVARKALAALLTTNTPQAAKDGIAMLRMLVANLITQPNVPRYRRIATSNDNFKKRVLPLEGHREMMEAIGFRAKGSLWEWTWHENSGPTASADNKTVLEDVVATIDAAGRKNGASQTPTPTLQAVAPAAGAHQAFVPRPTVARTTNPSAPGSLSPVLPTDTGAHYSSTIRGAAEITEFDGCGLSPAWKAAPADAAGAPASFASLSSNGNTTINSLSGEGTAPAPALVGCSTSLLAAAAEANRFVSSAGKAAGVTVGAERWLANQGRGMVAGPDSPGAAHVQVGEKEVLGEAECRDAAGAAASPREILMGHKGYRDSGDDATGKNQPTAPVSMAEVAAAIQRGEEPPGIRKVEDRLSADAPTFVMTSSQPSPPKPWQTAHSGARSGMEPESAAAAASARTVVRMGTPLTHDTSVGMNGASAGVNGGGCGGEGGGIGGCSVGDDGDRSLQSPPRPLSSQSPQQAVSVGP